MATLLTIMYAFFFILVGIEGNAPDFLSMVGEEKQYLYWFLVLVILAALWEAQTSVPLAREACVLIVLGFLLANKNWQTIGANAKTIMPAL